jgi:predicted transcriptional regulator
MCEKAHTVCAYRNRGTQPGMITTLQPQDIERAAKELGMSINALCHEAGVARSGFTRWKNGKNYTVENVNKLITALNAKRDTMQPNPS